MKNDIRETTIRGCHIALYPMQSVQTIVLRSEFRMGSWYEPATGWGATHLLEHMLHHGTKSFKNTDALELFKEEHGIGQNAYTGGIHMGIDANAPVVSLDPLLTIWEELAFYPLIPESKLPNEKKIVVQEYRDKWSNPTNRFWKEKQKFLYGADHMYARDALGEPQAIESFTRAYLVSLHKQFIGTDNMTIALAGNFDPDVVIPKLEAILSKAPQGHEQRLTFSSFTTEGQYFYHKEDVDRAAIHITYFIPGRHEMSLQDRIALSVASYILGGSFYSLLMRRLRLELGLIYGGGADFSLSFENGEFVVHCSTSLEKAQEAYKEMTLVLGKFLAKGVSAADFERAKKYQTFRTLMMFDSPQRITNFLAHDLFWYKRIETIEETVAAIESLEQKDMLRLMRSYLESTPVISCMAKEDPALQL